MHSRRLATTLAVAMALLILLSLGVMTALAVWRSAAALRSRSLATNETVTAATGRAVEQYVADALAIVREAAERPKLHADIVREDWPETEVVLRNVARHFRQFDYLFIQDAQGIIRARVPPAGTVGQDFSFRDFFQEARRTRQPFVSDVYVSQAAQRPVVALAVPVLSGETVRAVLVGALGLDPLTRFLARPAGDVERVVIVVDRRGVTLADSSRPDGPATLTPNPIAPLVRGNTPGTTVMEDPATGARILSATAPIGTLGWTVVTTTPAAAVSAPTRGLAWSLVATAVACTVGAVVLGVVVARSLTRPLAELTGSARRLAAGDYEARVPVTGTDEVATVGSAFNQMAAAMAESHRGLAQRTAELEALTRRLKEEASERDRAERGVRAHAERLAILHEIDQAILSTESPQAIAGSALQHMRRLVRTPRASLSVYDTAAGTGTWLAVDGAGPTILAAGTSFPLELMGDLKALARGETQIMDVAALGHLPQARTVATEGVRSFAVVPLRSRGVLIGSLNLGAAEPGGPPPEGIAVAREVADQLAVALQQARLYTELEGHAAELEQRVAARTTELAAASAEVERASRAKTEFLSRMSHELRTPLNVILGFAALLEMDDLSPDQQDTVRHILRAGRHLLDLINEVLDISRIEAGQLRLSLEPVLVREALQDAVSLIEPLAAQRQVALRFEGTDGQYVLADRQRLQQVLLNLLSNAVKYNHPGGWVAVSCTPTPERRLRLLVTDSGWGMTEDQLRRLFTPFDRLGAEQREQIEGTGLGLTLARHLVEAMGGALRVTSAPGRGSTFAFELELAEGPTLQAGAAPATAARAGAAAPDLTVLYVEDNLPNLHLVEKLIARRPGIRLISAIQGRVGLDLAREHRPDLILLDRHLPDVPGEEILQQVLADPRIRHVPVVFLSADATPGEIQRLLAAGAHGYLTKPLDVPRLYALLDEVDARKEGPHHG